MKQVVEITIDLTDSNCKPRIEAFEITKVGKGISIVKGKESMSMGEDSLSRTWMK